MNFFVPSDFICPNIGSNFAADFKINALFNCKIFMIMALFDFLFGSDEQPRRSGNWTDADDWQCGEQDDHDGMYGFDSYEENDF